MPWTSALGCIGTENVTHSVIHCSLLPDCDDSVASCRLRPLKLLLHDGLYTWPKRKPSPFFFKWLLLEYSIMAARTMTHHTGHIAGPADKWVPLVRFELESVSTQIPYANPHVRVCIFLVPTCGRIPICVVVLIYMEALTSGVFLNKGVKW